jgi:hypothetical protein
MMAAARMQRLVNPPPSPSSAPRSVWLALAREIFAALTLFLATPTDGAPPTRDVAVVANPSVPDQVLKRPTAWAIFSMRLRTWSDGSATSVFVLNDNMPMHAEFTKKILDTFPYQLRRAWDRLVFSGTGQAPTEVESIDEMYKRIVSTPGAIGYLPGDRIDSRVRELKVE